MIIDKMRHQSRRQDAQDSLRALGISPYDVRRLTSLADQDCHPLPDEVSIFLQVRDHFCNIYHSLLSGRGMFEHDGPWALEITLNAGFGPLDAYYDSLPDESQRPDGYRWETLLLWRWCYEFDGINPIIGDVQWSSADYDIPVWPGSEILVEFLAPNDHLRQIFGEEVALSAPWCCEFIHGKVVEDLPPDWEEIPLGVARCCRL